MKGQALSVRAAITYYDKNDTLSGVAASAMEEPPIKTITSRKIGLS
jgi:hypothetical protein